MNTQQLAQVRTIRTAYGQMMTNGYTHEHAITMLLDAYKEMPEPVLARGLWLDPSTPWCDPV